MWGLSVMAFSAALSFPVGCLFFTGFMIANENKALSVKSSFVRSYSDARDMAKVENIVVRAEDVFNVEITETVMMSDMEKRMAVLEDLRQSGFLIEMDDFGSGYSSLNMLKDMPVDVVKIDMAFLRRNNQASIPRAKAIVREIIALARALDIISLTEGVETEEQYHNLMAMGCELYQGYYFSKPIPLDQFEEHFCSAD